MKFNNEDRVHIKTIGVKGVIKEINSELDKPYKITYFQEDERKIDWFKEEDLDFHKGRQKLRGFEPVKKEMRKNNIEPTLPLRGTKTSAGYDFYTPVDINLSPNGSAQLIWTDIKAYMQNREVLKIYIRSSVGTKLHCILANSVGIIDSDYYSNKDNDGNIGIMLMNLSDKEVNISAGDRIAQGIFQSFLESDNCNTEIKRDGGIGHTGTK